MTTTTIPTRTLGTNGLDAGALGLGCMGMSDAYGDYDEDRSLRTIERAVEAGAYERYPPRAPHLLIELLVGGDHRALLAADVDVVGARG